jgi:saccharopine dehydrogenase (NAD+, L-lysine-forming)
LKVAILGAGGTIAPPIVRDLAESPEVAAMRLLDIDGARAGNVAREHGGGKAEARAIDGRDAGALSAALADVDLLVNAASYRINLDAMEAALAAGCHYVDLGGLYHVTAEQLKLHERFERVGLLALLGVGSAPGKTNLMAALAAERLGGVVERIEISAGGRDLDPPDGFAPPYALQTLIDELTLKPIVLHGGEAVELEPLADAGLVTFPAPIGEAPTIFTLHSELLTFGESFGCGECDFRLSLAPALLQQLTDLAGATPAEIAHAQEQAVRPSAQTVSCHIVDAWSGTRHLRVTCKSSPIARWGLGGSVVSTSAPVAAAVRLLARGRIEARGALPPERAIVPQEMIDQLRDRNAVFSLTEDEETILL